ncbi:DUF6779 domain-containing protein, partial [Saccharomonospora saliphila]|uniref:DUF6779 domain-containing protein n=1 Tax=Saccharomonospora saliphila TaxID=369829 RepID=UPI002FBE70DC
MTGVGDDSRGRATGRPWLAVGFLLAIGATLALVLTDDLRWIRLAVVAALWAALIGALMAVKYRRAAATSEKSAAKAQQIYELELQKEIAARREFELETEAEARRRAEAESREELDALRGELSALRENLQTLFGGEVLWERVALTAQSTRMRSFGEEPRLVPAGDAAEDRPAITVGSDGAEAEAFDRPTELISRAADADAERVADRRGGARNGAARGPRAVANGAAVNGAPANGAAANGAVANGATANGALANGAPADGVPGNAVPARGAAAHGAVANGAAAHGQAPNGTPNG